MHSKISIASIVHFDGQGHLFLNFGNFSVRLVYVRFHSQETMKQDIAPFHVDRKRYHLTFDTAPVWVCVQCGEVCFEDPEIEAIQEVIQTIEQQTSKRMLVRYNYLEREALLNLNYSFRTLLVSHLLRVFS